MTQWRERRKVQQILFFRGYIVDKRTRRNNKKKSSKIRERGEGKGKLL